MNFMWNWLILIVVTMESVLVTGKDDNINIKKAAACRDARTWPFLSTSIWNTPIGSGAIFHDPGIFRRPLPQPYGFYTDDDHFIITTSDDPPTPWYDQGWWGPPSGEGHCNITGRLIGNISFPFNVTVREFDKNNAAALLQPDKHTIINTQPLYRCQPGSPVLSEFRGGIEGKDDIVFGNGTWGAHGGSGLSSIGGTIRLGELLPDAPPIRHALKLQLDASTYYYGRPPGYVWPALYCDSYAFNPNVPGHYAGNDIYLSPGSLLAIPSNITVNVTTEPGQKMLFTLQNYGGYLCDDTYYNCGTVGVEPGVTDEFKTAYGYPFSPGSTGPGAAWYADMLVLFQSLHVVINNRNDTVGGGGIPLQPPPPPICPI
jgi:hypothetical protein